MDVKVPADLSACGSDAYVIFAPVVQSFAATSDADLTAAQQVLDSIAIRP